MVSLAEGFVSDGQATREGFLYMPRANERCEQYAAAREDGQPPRGHRHLSGGELAVDHIHLVRKFPANKSSSSPVLH